MRTVQNATDDLRKILAWHGQIPTVPTENRSIGKPSPGTNTEDKLPFGLDSLADNLDDGYAGIRTPGGAIEWLRVIASWAATSGFGSTPDPAAPGQWILSVLESPYPWETWDEWEDWANELHEGRKHIGRLIGHVAQYRLPCPRCAEGTLRQVMGSNGRSDQLSCKCGATYEDEQQVMRVLRSYAIQPETITTPDQLTTIWGGHLDPKKLRVWITRGHIPTFPDGTLNLWVANVIIRARLACAEAA